MESIIIKPGNTVATSVNLEKTLALYNFWDIEFKSKSFLYRQVNTNYYNIRSLNNWIICNFDNLYFEDKKYGWCIDCSWKWKNKSKKYL